jgi:hypothetical protein
LLRSRGAPFRYRTEIAWLIDGLGNRSTDPLVNGPALRKPLIL